MKFLLIKASICWADEFDCEVFGVFTDKEWKDICKKTKKTFEENGQIEVAFGTNQCLEFSSYEDWLCHFKKTEITGLEAKFLKDNFGNMYGTGSGVFEVYNFID